MEKLIEQFSKLTNNDRNNIERSCHYLQRVHQEERKADFDREIALLYDYLDKALKRLEGY